MKQSYRPRDLILLTGTPLSTPADIYGYSRFLNPNWLTKGIFEAHHVAEYDHFGQPLKWKTKMSCDEFSWNSLVEFSKKMC